MKSPTKRKRADVDLQQEGRVLIKHGIKAQSIAIEFIDAYTADKTQIADKDWGCYMLQQSIELLLKGLIKYYGEDYRSGHLVKYNAQLLLTMSEHYPELREIQDTLSTLATTLIASEMQKWQSIARYKELCVKFNAIKQADEISETLVQYIRRYDYLSD